LSEGSGRRNLAADLKPIAPPATRQNRISPQFHDSVLPKSSWVFYDIRSIGVCAGVHVRVLGWIKSAVEFIKKPAGPHKAEPQPDAPQPDAPREIDSGTLPQDTSPDVIEIQPDRAISVEPETGIETRSSAQPETRISVEPESAPNEQEIDRRRGIVRAFFNDYWSSVDDKPTSFAERLDRAEAYINERVAAGGEAWRLGPATRKQLGLPPSKKA
jgi:hypothetical protein